MGRNLIIAEKLRALGFQTSEKKKAAKGKSGKKPISKRPTFSKARKNEPAKKKKPKYRAQPPFVEKKQALLNSIQHVDESDLPPGFIEEVIHAKTITAISRARKLVTPVVTPRYGREIEERGIKKNFYKLIYIARK